MKLLTSPASFNREFGRLIKHYRHLDWAVAWATNRHESFDLLIKNRHKIRRIIVGTQFHQTAPEFIDAFKSVPKVRFRIDQEGLNGVFHPKLYLFSNSATDWEVVIGSANFTAGAFKKNTEHAVLISSAENPDGVRYGELVKEVERLWKKGRHFTPAELEDYRSRWSQARPLLNRAASRDDEKVIDTVVVPMHQDGFAETFIEENRWYSIRIGKRMLDKLQYLAAYQTAPVSAITHFAEVEAIKRWRNTRKYELKFTSKGTNEIRPIELVPKSKVIALRGPRYASLQKLLTAKNLDQAF